MFKVVKKWFKRPRDPSGYVYYARLKTSQGTFYKLGYTAKSSLAERMSFSGLGDEKLVDRQFLFAFHKDAWDVEQTLLEYFDMHRAFGKFSNNPSKPLAGRGQSELFAYDILGLDSDLYRLSSEEMEVLKNEIDKTKDGCFMVLVGLVLAPFTLGFSLLFIAGGLSGVFGKGSISQQVKNQPEHPKKIRELIASLAQATRAGNNVA